MSCFVRESFHGLATQLREAAIFEGEPKKGGIPQKITLDGYAASHVAVGELQEEGILLAKLLVRPNRYLNHVIKQDH